jgi:hypothetical protein
LVFTKIYDCTGFGLIGLAIGCGIIYLTALATHSIDTRWLGIVGLCPFFGVIFGLKKVSSGSAQERDALILYLPCTAVLCAAGMYLAFIITAHTWYLANPRAPRVSLAYHVMNPDSVPALHRRRGGTDGWRFWTLAGAIAGPFALWRVRKEMLR